MGETSGGALMMFCSSGVRAQLVERFRQLGLSQGVSLELEYFAQRISASNFVSYKVVCNRLIDKLVSSEDFASQLEEKGFGACVTVVGGEEMLDRALETQSDREMYEERLKTLAARNDIRLPEAGMRCSRCQSTDLHVNCKQTRSADEPMTVFISCVGCSKRWRL